MQGHGTQPHAASRGLRRRFRQPSNRLLVDRQVHERRECGIQIIRPAGVYHEYLHA